jgi:hypothetical protein
MDDVVRLLLRFLLVPLGYCAGALAATLVILIASWRLIEIAGSGHGDASAYVVFGFAIGGPILLVVVLVMMFLPASIGILISEAFAIRSWMFHALNGIVSAWVGWSLFGHSADGNLPPDQPVIIVAAGIAGGFAYWAVAGFSAGFWKPVFKRGAEGVPMTTPR